MISDALILMLEALVVYFLVLGAHALRHRFGPAHFYALLGGLTAVMSWVTDAGVSVTIAGITFIIGSTVFYTALLLGVFVVYVFDGPRRARVAISTVLGVSILVPLIGGALHLQMGGQTSLAAIPEPSLRINTASVLTTFMDLIFLGIAWEILGRTRVKIGLWLRTYLTLLGVMWLDVLLFATGAFSGTPNYLAIMSGTFLTRLVISMFAFPFLFGYIRWQNRRADVMIVNRPVLSILHEFFELEEELSRAQREIDRRKKVEHERNQLIKELEKSREEYKELSEYLHEISITDDLTGIANRRFFNITLDKEWKRAVRKQHPVSLLILDVDQFKEINDRFGHLAGDRKLQQTAEALDSALKRPADLLARYGGDEFSVILPDTDQDGAREVAERCQTALGDISVHPDDEDQAEHITVSIGICTGYPERASTPEPLLGCADQALYRAKEGGGDQIETLDFDSA